MIGRRSVLLAPLALAGCGIASAGTVRVAVTWSDWELSRFRVVLREFENQYGYATEVVPLGDDIAAVLGSRRGGAVDVVMLPQIWAVRDLGDRLEPLDAFASPFPQVWRTLLTHSGKVRGIPFKISHKSVVWYRKDLFDEHNVEPPTTFQAWKDLNVKLADTGVVAPLALAGADGWVLADFFENVLHGRNERVYEALASGEESWQSQTVLQAFRDVGDMWSVPGALSGGATGALLTQAEGAVVDHFLRGRAAMIAGADFTYPVITRLQGRDLAGEWLDWFPFPWSTADRRPPKVAGDVVVLPSPASKGAVALAGWLAQASAQRIWAADGGMLSVHPGVHREVYPDRIRKIADQVREPPIGGRLVFNLADRLGVTGVALRRVLADFLRDVGGNKSRVDAAAKEAAARVDQIARRPG